MGLPSILVVDDDKNLLELVKIRLESAQYEVTTAPREEEGLDAMRRQTFDLALVDLQLGRQDGIALMEEFHAINPDMPVIIFTAHGSIESAVDAVKRGAFNYVTKPFDPQELLLQIERALESRKLNAEIKRLKGLLEERFDFSNIIARSDSMRRVLEQVSRIAATDCTVYVHGESGTGKELIAKAIHLASPRKEKPFVAINCAAIPENLLESELFGHERGAFTGAIKSSKGLFARAHEGTILLDEIGDMPLSIQAKLLRVLQERQFYPVGSEKPIEVDIRVIVATNKNLEVEVREGRFREDLFYRIHVIPIHLPPLRDRREDIPLLAEYYLNNFSKEMGKKLKGFTPEATQKLMLYDWPGNVRELRNTIEYAAAMAHQDMITDDLILHKKEVQNEELLPLKEARESFEKGYLIRILEFSRGNVSRAAQMAGKYRADFYNLLKKYNLNPEVFKKTTINK
ncbi:MAG: sigma-54 dependent transcriptional regulator [Nitrospirota bacterium]